MDRFNVINTKIDGLYEIEPLIHQDNRGYYIKIFEEDEFIKKGLPIHFLEENQSKSSKGVIRGLHFQHTHSQGKLARVVKGKIYQVAVDLRKDSKTFGKWVGVILSEENKKMLYIPEGFASGFLSLENDTIFAYKCTDRYYPEEDSGIMWNDKDLNIDWPLDQVDDLIISEKDQNWKPFKESKFSF